jgi:hypothetical protein
MKRAIIAAVSIALMAGVGTASAKTSNKKGSYDSQGRFTQQKVKLQSATPLPNADLKYGPYPEYPQSPPGGGY